MMSSSRLEKPLGPRQLTTGCVRHSETEFISECILGMRGGKKKHIDDVVFITRLTHLFADISLRAGCSTILMGVPSYPRGFLHPYPVTDESGHWGR